MLKASEAPKDSQTEVDDSATIQQKPPDETILLIESLQKDSSNTFPLFMKEYGGLIDGLVRRFMRSPEDQEDLYQEVVLALLKDDCHRVAAWDPNRAPFPAFLYLVVWRLCASYRKKIQRGQRFQNNPGPDSQQHPVSVTDLAKTTPTQRSGIAFSELTHQIEECFELIIKSGAAREEDKILVLLRAEGYAAKRVGEFLGLGDGVVHTRFKRVRERLRDCLMEHGFESIADVLTDFDPSGSIY
ncbi:MAG: RNA polymerase sigma factor [Candidatus Omnitrophica bacterium]|nr:RNA polymerase sigma factor [Candidatus Omnitrophota bacterium]